MAHEIMTDQDDNAAHVACAEEMNALIALQRKFEARRDFASAEAMAAAWEAADAAADTWGDCYLRFRALRQTWEGRL